jgi:hypothetical protein
MSAAVLAGMVSTTVFASSMLPMVVRAWRTRDLSSYSRSHLVMTNAGNAVHTLYVASLPVGPVWLLHSFHVAVAATMLVWHLRFVDARPSRHLTRGAAQGRPAQPPSTCSPGTSRAVLRPASPV